jgi:hypothetical protein
MPGPEFLICIDIFWGMWDSGNAMVKNPKLLTSNIKKAPQSSGGENPVLYHGSQDFEGPFFILR